MTLWGYQVDLDVYVYSNVYVTLIQFYQKNKFVTPIHVKRKKKKKKKKVTVCEEEKITIKIGFISIIK